MIKVKVRWVTLLEWKILLCKLSEFWFFCLPWWTMDWWENRKETLKREFIEELWVEPEIGALLYINEFVKWDKTTLDFRYNIENPKDFLNIDVSKASHGFEISEVWFYSLEDFGWDLRPDFLPNLLQDLEKWTLTLNKS